jgi:integrase
MRTPHVLPPDGLAIVGTEAVLSDKLRQKAERAALDYAYHNKGRVFAMADGTLSSVRRSRIRLHDLRDTHANLLAKHGVPSEVVSKRLSTGEFAESVRRC